MPSFTASIYHDGAKVPEGAKIVHLIRHAQGQHNLAVLEKGTEGMLRASEK